MLLQPHVFSFAMGGKQTSINCIRFPITKENKGVLGFRTLEAPFCVRIQVYLNAKQR